MANLSSVNKHLRNSCQNAMQSWTQDPFENMTLEKFVSYVADNSTSRTFLQGAVYSLLRHDKNFEVNAETIRRLKHVCGFDPETMTKKTRKLVNRCLVVFSQAGLFQNANLAGADLAGIPLENVNFYKTYLGGVKAGTFQGALCGGAFLAGLELTGFYYMEDNSLRGANLQGADCRGVLFQQQFGYAVDLNLAGALVTKSQLSYLNQQWRKSGGLKKPPFSLTEGDARWLPDSHSENCLRCHAQFTRENRRHHCRTCGWLVCDACSPFRTVYAVKHLWGLFYQLELLRTCKHCASPLGRCTCIECRGRHWANDDGGPAERKDG
jgi:uncharacterized protein YjbI with pentapeptide repeats